MTRAIALLWLLVVATAAHGAPLDEYYLRKFNLAGGTQARATGVVTQVGTPVERCRTWLYHDLRRDWGKLEPQTQKVLAKVLPVRPAWPDEQPPVLSPGGHFRIHYTLTGDDAPPSVDWVNTVAQTMDDEIGRAHV